MRVPLADLVTQYRCIKNDVDDAIQGVLESGHFILGSTVAAFESETARLSGAAFGIGVNSGTDALRLALMAYDIGDGDEVITTPFTFVATIEAIAQVGARPVFADIDPVTFNLCPVRTAERFTSRTRAIMPVDLFGQMADRHAFRAIVDRTDAALIWDSAQAIGASFDGRPLGAYGDTSTLSFFPTKNLGAFGDGGMILTNDTGTRDAILKFRFHGSGGGYFYQKIGYCSRLDAIQAAILSVKLVRLDEWNRARRKHAGAYRELLAGTQAILPVEDPRCYHTYHQYTIRHPRRDALKSYLAESGIDSGIYYPLALHLQQAYAWLGYEPGDFPESERAMNEVLSIPVHQHLSDDQVAYVAEAIRRFDTV